MTETELLFTEILNCQCADLYLNPRLPLSRDQSLFISSALKRRLKGEPIQYILGKTEFMGLEFKVTPDVFIPRPETEILVEKVIDIVKLLNCQTVKLLDVGTGSGCIVVSLAKYLPSVKVVATDISPAALQIAKYNSKLNKLEDRIEFIQDNVFNITHYTLHITQPYDLVIANPPYIPTSEIEHLQPEIQYEPRIALDGGGDGLGFYRRIIEQAPQFLSEKGYLILEMGFGQCKSIKQLFKLSGKFEIIEVVKDYNHIDRIIITQKI